MNAVHDLRAVTEGQVCAKTARPAVIADWWGPAHRRFGLFSCGNLCQQILSASFATVRNRLDESKGESRSPEWIPALDGVLTESRRKD